MDWLNTLMWVLRGSAAGMALFLTMVVAVYALVPLETPRAQDAPSQSAARHQAG
ncbi:MAG: hypothetical protein FD187_2820 [bacterium]|nr:MAG: hypothetical protein FD142_2649 [bacterium]KAF0147373.1 MAG: hypothetical protein FD187_2820 [bacterium]KAF0167224.1 MAG: hypothetical protein FD158_2472 [bacterium]TXT19221.1 MAG: hypothetical protein FD132_1821 [bacterium]